MTKYICAMCNEEFEGGPVEEALAEKDALFGGIPLDGCDVVCDDCWQEVRPDRNPYPVYGLDYGRGPVVGVLRTEAREIVTAISGEEIAIEVNWSPGVVEITPGLYAALSAAYWPDNYALEVRGINGIKPGDIMDLHIGDYEARYLVTVVLEDGTARLIPAQTD